MDIEDLREKIVYIPQHPNLFNRTLEENLMYFYSPTEIANGEAPKARTFRIGGLVLTDSVKRNPNNLEVNFVLTDTVNQIKVIYDGILPDLFREGQGIVANGKMKSENIFPYKM